MSPDAVTIAPSPDAAAPEGWSSLRGVRIGTDSLIELQHPYAGGGMGEIWAAWMHDPRSPRRVAVKLIRRGLESALADELFAREIEMHDRVRDVPGVVPLIESGSFVHPESDDRVRFFAMEWIAGARPLDQACRSLGLAEILTLFTRLAATLDVVHKRAVVHCDLKPANILVDETGCPWVTDFGLAISTRTHERRHTGGDIGELRGTWTHMAPEQCDARCDPYAYTAAVDVYALGVTLFQCVTGRLPYVAPDETFLDRSRAASLIRGGARVPRRCDGRTLPFALRTCLLKALSPNATARHADAGEFERDLRPLAEGTVARDRRTAAAATIVAALLSMTLLSPALHHPSVYSRWYSMISGLAGATPLRDVTVVGIRGELARDASGAETYVNLETAELSKRPPGSTPPVGASTSERVFLSHTIDRLRELGARVAMLDYYFPREGDPADAATLVRAMRDFRGDDATPRGWICFGTRDWKSSDGEAPVERRMLEMASHAFALKTTLGVDVQQMGHEVAMRDAARHDWASASMMAAAASLCPLAEPSVHIEVRRASRSAEIEFQYRARDRNAAARESITLRTDASTVEELSNEGDASIAYPDLDPRDVICSIDLPRIPSADALDRACLRAADLWSFDESSLRRRLEGRVVVVGDLLTRREQAQADPSIDRWMVPGHSRPVWGVELQAIAVQAARDALLGVGRATESDGGLLVRFGVPAVSVAGVALAREFSRRRRRSVHRSIATLGLAFLALNLLAAAGSYASWLWVWNPFVLPTTFATATTIGLLSPWIRTSPR